jgi:hypothetical protein
LVILKIKAGDEKLKVLPQQLAVMIFQSLICREFFRL